MDFYLSIILWNLQQSYKSNIYYLYDKKWCKKEWKRQNLFYLFHDTKICFQRKWLYFYHKTTTEYASSLFLRIYFNSLRQRFKELSVCIPAFNGYHKDIKYLRCLPKSPNNFEFMRVDLFLCILPDEQPSSHLCT